MTDPVLISGYASVFGRPYDVGGLFTETIVPGAFRRSLGNPSLDVPLVLNHEGLPLARTISGTLRLAEDATGLRVDADLDPTDPDVMALAPKMRRGDVTEMSFRFRATSDDWSRDLSERTVTGAEIHRGDVSIVTFGSSPSTSIAMRADGGDFEQRSRAKERMGARVETRGQIVAVDGIEVAAASELLRPATPRSSSTSPLPAFRGDEFLLELRARRQRARYTPTLTDRDRQELQWRARSASSSVSALSEAAILAELLGRAHAGDDRSATRRRRSGR